MYNNEYLQKFFNYKIKRNIIKTFQSSRVTLDIIYRFIFFA